MTANLETDLRAQVAALDPTTWSPLQIEVCMWVANAKLYAFQAEAERVADLLRLNLITRPIAADCLQLAAIYNQLGFEYGQDAVQSIIATAFEQVAV
jgi:hypothetical protein